MDKNRRQGGWTTDRQLEFLHNLHCTGTVSRAAAAAGMSREGAYRLRNRQPDGLFAALWDMALDCPASRGPVVGGQSPGHNRLLTEGWLMRMVGNHFRREAADFAKSAKDGR